MARWINRTDEARLALKWMLGLLPIVAGVDKYFNKLTDWEQYVSPVVARFISPTTLLHIGGPLEIATGLLILSKYTRWGALILMLAMAAISINLVSTGGYYDIAARDVTIGVACFALMELSAARDERVKA